MYKDDMNEIYSQKREALTLFLGYSIPILLKLLYEDTFKYSFSSL